MLAALPIIEIALFGYLYLGGICEQESLTAELTASGNILANLPSVDYAQEMEIRNNQLRAAKEKSLAAGQLLTVFLEPDEIYGEILSLAGDNNVSVESLSSPGESVTTVNSYSFSVLPLNMNLHGAADDINNFANVLSGRFQTLTIKSLFLNSMGTGDLLNPSAQMNIEIYSYRGDSNETAE